MFTSREKVMSAGVWTSWGHAHAATRLFGFLAFCRALSVCRHAQQAPTVASMGVFA